MRSRAYRRNLRSRALRKPWRPRAYRRALRSRALRESSSARRVEERRVRGPVEVIAHGAIPPLIYRAQAQVEENKELTISFTFIQILFVCNDRAKRCRRAQRRFRLLSTASMSMKCATENHSSPRSRIPQKGISARIQIRSSIYLFVNTRNRRYENGDPNNAHPCGSEVHLRGQSLSVRNQKPFTDVFL